jgi:transcriptional regulator with XRE-family HTH domain
VKNIDQALAVTLRRLREQKGLSQDQVAFESGLHRTYISQLERGLKSITVKSLMRIIMVLGVDLHDFAKMVNDEYNSL